MTINRVIISAVARDLEPNQVKTFENAISTRILPIMQRTKYALNRISEDNKSTITLVLYRSGNANPANLSCLIERITSCFIAVGGTVDSSQADWSNALADLFEAGAPDAELPEKLAFDRPQKQIEPLPFPVIRRSASAPALFHHDQSGSPTKRC